MALDSTILRAMADAGCSIEQIIKVAEVGEFADREKQAARREAERMRKRRQRDREREAKSNAASGAVTVTRGTERDTQDTPSPPPAPSPDKEIPHTPLENNLFPEPPPQPRFSTAREFDAFWAKYPHKVGKADAFKAFDRAVKRVDLPTMMAGLDRYAAKTDDRPWCNPSTWLNQDRWADQPANSPSRQAAPRMTRVQQMRQNMEAEVGDFLQRRGSGSREENHDIQPARRLLAAGRQTDR